MPVHYVEQLLVAEGDAIPAPSPLEGKGWGEGEIQTATRP